MNINTLSERINSKKFDITIDTCSAMHVGFSQFIEKNKEWFSKEGVHISVSRDVVMELVRHLDRADTSEKALRAIALIKENEEIFDVDIVPMNDADISTAFADLEILNRINAGRLHRPQVLITNDKSLNGDVQRLNDLKSCHGKQVIAVYLDSFGNMRTDKSLKNETKCEPVSIVSEPPTAQIPAVIETVAEQEAEKTPVSIPSAGNQGSSRNQIYEVARLILIGIAIDRFGPKAIRACKRLIKTFAKIA